MRFLSTSRTSYFEHTRVRSTPTESQTFCDASKGAAIAAPTSDGLDRRGEQKGEGYWDPPAKRSPRGGNLRDGAPSRLRRPAREGPIAIASAIAPAVSAPRNQTVRSFLVCPSGSRTDLPLPAFPGDLGAPPASAAPEFRSSPFTIGGLWWVRRDSNPRPSVCRLAALPTELRTHTVGVGAIAHLSRRANAGRSIRHPSGSHLLSDCLKPRLHRQPLPERSRCAFTGSSILMQAPSLAL